MTKHQPNPYTDLKGTTRCARCRRELKTQRRSTAILGVTFIHVKAPAR
jgi:hypothetical protein